METPHVVTALAVVDTGKGVDLSDLERGRVLELPVRSDARLRWSWQDNVRA